MQILDPNPKTVSVGCCSNTMFFSNISAALEIMSEGQYGFVVCCVVTCVFVCLCSLQNVQKNFNVPKLT